MKSTNDHTPKIVGSIIISAVMLVGLYVFFLKDSSSNNVSATSAVVTTTDTSSSSSRSSNTSQDTNKDTSTGTSPNASGYTDGVYSATVKYSVPGERNTLNVSLTIGNGQITAVTTDSSYGDHESGSYIDSFESKVQSAVVGKPLSTSFSSRIGRASLTTSAFYSAIANIKTQAQV
jgi:uncharacterized protein with FMN-binding domain